jgi:sec-independent protein translocase protein TatA
MFYQIPLFLNLGTQELILIMFVVLLLFGGKKLPELARGLGKGLRDFKDASEGLKTEINNQINQIEEVKTDALNYTAGPVEGEVNSDYSNTETAAQEETAAIPYETTPELTYENNTGPDDYHYMDSETNYENQVSEAPAEEPLIESNVSEKNLKA